MPGHTLPRAIKALEDRSLLLHIRTNPDFIARKWYYHSIQHPSKLCKSAHYFWKLTIPWSSMALDRQSPKNSRPKKPPRTAMRLQQLRRSHRHIHTPTIATFTRHARYTRTRAFCAWHHGWRHPPLPRFDPDQPGNLTRSELLAKKKKKLKKEKRKRKSFDQVELELWLWLKSQNFQKGPVPLSFSSTFRFWDLFLHLKLGNCANCPIPKKLTFAQILTKKSKFSKSTCLAQFFV